MMPKRTTLRRAVKDSLPATPPVVREIEKLDWTVNGKSIPRQRLLGAYYTPDDVAEILVRWALRGRPGNLLDPCFGGCAFLEAGAKVFCELGRHSPGSKVFGVDVDASCIEYVRESARLHEANCRFQDFLLAIPEAMDGAPFQAIVGNPPYVRHHWVKDERFAVARQIARESSVTIPETASLWVYFVVHALAFLAPGGRMSMLVPEAILQADYASSVREVLAEGFGRVRLIHLRERLFEGTKEPVVVIAGEDFGSAGSVDVHSVETAKELEILLHGAEVTRPQTTLRNGRRVLPEVLETMARLETTRKVTCFQELATARIGLVTGANSHFIRSEDDLRNLGVPTRARTGIVSRTKWLAGLDFTHRDHNAIVSAGARAFLVRPTASLEKLPGVLRWIEKGEEANVDQHYKCKKRDPWFRVDLPARPDAFVTSTRLGPPLLVLNRTSLRCTNALYAVRFHRPDRVEQEALALGFLTTYVALWSELNGRRYGEGVLKLDLRTLGRLPLPVVPEASIAFKEASAALRGGDEAAARAIADDAVLRRGLGVSQTAVSSMLRALKDLARQRIPEKMKS